jgi:acyl-CoA synthetase (AMP-forming)/AMP-acid ligase II
MQTRGDIADLKVPDLPFGRLVLQRARAFGERRALVDGDTGRTLSYGELARALESVAANLSARGFEKGDVLAVYCPNVPEYAVAFYASALLGGVCTTVNSLYTAGELRRQLKDSGASYLLTAPHLLEKALEAAEGTAVREVFVVGEAEGATSLAALARGGGLAPDVPINAAEDVVALPYSSGMGGLPKGVMLTHRNLTSNLCQVDAARFVNAEDVVLGVLPFSHIYGLHAVMNVSLWNGATVVTSSSFDLRQFLGLIERYKVTFAPVVPSIMLSLARGRAVEKSDLSSLRTLVCSGDFLGVEVEAACREKFGCVVRQGYGMTETVVTFLSPPAPERIREGSAGLRLAETECKVLDPDTGSEVGAGEAGEICVRGPQLMKGYLNRPEETARAFDGEGWLHTGDVGYLDADGYLFITDRLKELIKYNAFQVAPAELEALLLSHPDVADAVVVPTPDEKVGEVPKALVVMRGAATPEELTAFVAARVAPYKKIRRVEVVERLPKSESGEVLRRRLIEREREAARRREREA